MSEYGIEYSLACGSETTQDPRSFTDYDDAEFAITEHRRYCDSPECDPDDIEIVARSEFGF